jgi:uroporphyrinogen decarboxylase
MSNQSRQRVIAALNFRQPDLLPLFENYWPAFIEQWRVAKGLSPQAVGRSIGNYYGSDVLTWGQALTRDISLAHAINDYYGNDMLTAAADESPWPSQRAKLEQTENHTISRNGWGNVSRTVKGAYFAEELSVALKERVDPDKLTFESPYLESRYETPDALEFGNRYAIFAKTGGPFKRPSFLRGYMQFLLDIAEDPAWVKACIERVMAHLTAVGVEQLRRHGPNLVGIQINDDSCALNAPLMSPQTYERICLPSLRKMVQAYKDAGASIVYMHCDGNVMPLVEMWVDVGIDAIHPCEPRAGVDVFALHDQYGGKLAFIGAVDNNRILPAGSKTEIVAHIRALAELGRDGGVVIGGHSIGPDISIAHYEWAMAARRRYGMYKALEGREPDCSPTTRRTIDGR